jgi:hypothetical protein
VVDDYRIRHTAAKQQNYKEVRVSPTKLECSDVTKRDRLCFRVADLEPEEEYIIQVAAHTRGGDWSEWSDELKARTEDQSTAPCVAFQTIHLRFQTFLSSKCHCWSPTPSRTASHWNGKD